MAGRIDVSRSLRFLSCTAGLLIAGCASVPLDPGQATPISSDGYREGAQTLQTPTYNAELTVVRDSGGTVFGIAFEITVVVDGKPVAALERPGTRCSIFVTPGLHTVNVGRSISGQVRVAAGVEVNAAAATNTILHTGEGDAANEPMRVFVGNIVPIQN